MQAQGPNGETTPGHDRWNPQYPSTNMQAPNMISTQANRPPPGVVRPPGVRPPMPFQARPPPAFAAQPGYRPSVHPAPTSAPSAARPPAPAAEFSPSAPVDTLSPQMANMNIQTAPAFKPGRSKRVYAPSADIPKAPSNAQPPVYPNAQRSSYSTTQPPLHSNVQQPPGYAPAGPGVPQQLSPSVPKSRIDPDQIPSPVQLQMKDQELYLHQQYGTFSQDMSFPLSTTDFRAVDQGNCNPRFMRCTLREVPQAHDLVRDAELPFGIVVQPLAALPAEDGAVPVVSPGADGPVRCRRCHGYLNCWCNFIDGGRKFVCNLCGFDNEVPENYFCPVDMTGRRVDTEQRPELRHGTVEFEVPEEYWMRDPQPLNYVFAVDVSWSAVKSGMLSSFCAALKQTLPLLTGGTKISIMTFDSVSSLDQAQMMVVSDIDDIFLPLAEGFLVDPQDSRSVIEDLLDNLPRMFNDNKIPSAVLGAAIKGASLSLKVTGGKLCVFQSVLPTIGPGTLKNRDDSKLYGTDKENKLFTPQDDFYTAMAKECSKDGVSIDLWLFPQNTYVDVSTLGALSELTGGETHYYYNFDHERSSLRFTNDFECSFRREQGYDAALRLRCSNGITIENQYGNFHMTNATDIVLAGIDADKSIGFTLDHDSKLTDNSMAYFQCALLYTTQTGQRRVRLHNMCLPVTSNIPALFRQADLDATINLITKKVISQSTKVGLLQLASDLEKQCVNILAAYRKYCATDASTGQLILPESFKLLPVYTLALRKSVVLRKDVSITADNRVYNLRKIKAAGLAATLRWLYPRMVKVHELEGQDVTPMERLSYLRLHPTGIYLIDSRDTTFIWVGQHASTDLLEHIFGVTQLDQVDPRMVQLPSLDHPLSQRLRNMTQSPTITVVRQSLDPENELAQTLVEDETYGQMTYVDYLCLVHKQIQNNLEKEKRDTLMASASIWAQRKSNYQDAQSKDLEYYPQDHEIEDYHLSTKPYEINEVTIIRKTIATFATQEIDSSDEEDMEEADASSRSFLSRLIAIPLIHDGVWSTQHLMRQYYVGRIVADQTELAVRSISHYVENSMANNLGNRSLDLVEQKFPMVHTPTQEVKNKIGSALQRVRLAPNQASRRALTALDRYLRSDDKQLLRRIVDNTCPNQKTLNKWMAQIKAMRARLPRPLQHLLNPLLNTAQQEYDMLRLEFQQTHTPIERARNIVSLQKEVIVMPLWYSLSDLMYNGKAKKIH